MCYESAQLAERIYRDAIRSGASEEELEYLRKNWEEKKRNPVSKFYHVSGFDHPDLVAFEKHDNKLQINKFTWGLIPHWAKDEHQAREIRNRTLNARGETIFEKPSFRDAAKDHRIIIPLDGFFEHYHKNGKTYPHFIRQQDRESLLVGGLASNWTNPNTAKNELTMTIVTTRANPLMQEIHNNPKLKEPRMPLVLDAETSEIWLGGNQREVEEIIRPSNVALEFHTVRRLKGKHSVGNSPEAHEKFHYPELDEPMTLF